MRTPRSAEASGYEEPDYYRNYGANIFRYTALKDKKELETLSERETKELAFLERLIPSRAMNDWMGRRDKNFAANKKLIDLAKSDNFNYLLLGRDDNAPWSQTHYESRHLKEYGGTDKKKYMAVAGIDEVGLMLITRAINDGTKNVPFIFVKYNWGRGGDTVPLYSDEKIDDSIDAEILATGANRVKDPDHADFVLVVNTNTNGETYEAQDAKNASTPRDGTRYIVDTVADYVAEGRQVVVADIAFANGADNALMEQFGKRRLLTELHAYAGWNTATNSTGFAISQGILAKKMSPEDKRDMLVTRLLDDWAYQANVRNVVAAQLKWVRGDGFYGSLNDKVANVTESCNRMILNFVESNLPPFEDNGEFSVKFPWNRMFEADILRGRDIPKKKSYFKRD